jgi:hypothetical protein
MNQGTNPETPGWWPVYPESMFHGLSKHLRDVTEAYTFDTLTIRGHGTTVICLELRMVTVTVNTWCLTSQVTHSRDYVAYVFLRSTSVHQCWLESASLLGKAFDSVVTFASIVRQDKLRPTLRFTHAILFWPCEFAR